MNDTTTNSAGSQARVLLFEGLNRAADEVISVDPDTAADFAGLLGKVFCIDLTFPSLTLYLLPEPDGFRLVPESPGEPDVTLKGSIFGFAKMSGKGAGKVISDGQVTMQGDAEAGQALQKIFARFDFDWEELIARVFGDTAARKAGNAVRRGGARVRQSASLGRENLADYLVEEKRVLVGGVALDRFAKKVDALRADTDRLAQRIQRLQNRLHPRTD